MSKPEVLTWDWKEQLDMADLASALRRLGSRIRVYEVDTGSDQFAFVLSNDDLTEEQVAEVWHKEWES